MKTFHLRSTATALVALAMLAILALTAPNALAEGRVTGATMHVSGAMKTGLPVTLTFDLDGYTIPRGSYASINIRVLSGPEGKAPSTLPGYPESQMTFHAPGAYTLDVILSQISKSSCGGVDSTTLFREKRTITIE